MHAQGIKNYVMATFYGFEGKFSTFFIGLGFLKHLGIITLCCLLVSTGFI